MSKVSSSHDKKILAHLALVGDLEEDIEEMEVEVDTEVDHHQDLVVDTVEVLALEDLHTEADHLVDQEDMMAKAEKEDHHQVDTHLLVVMRAEVDIEVDHHQDLVVDTVEVLALEDQDIVVLRVEAMVVTRSVIVGLVDTVSHDPLSIVEMLDIMHTLSEENSSSLPKTIHPEYSGWIVFLMPSGISKTNYW
jgi:hypothetical protein